MRWNGLASSGFEWSWVAYSSVGAVISCGLNKNSAELFGIEKYRVVVSDALRFWVASSGSE